MGWLVELYQTARGVSVLDEAAEEFTAKQMNAINRHLNRLALHDGNLGTTFFLKPQGSREIREYRVTAQDIEVRMLFVLQGEVYWILKIFKHKKRDDVGRYLDMARARLSEWRNR